VRTAIAIFLLVPVLADAQALPNLAAARVQYSTRKNTVDPQGELKAQIDEVDKAIAAAARIGNNGEVRRQLAKGMALLNGTAWTAALDYRHSLVLRSEHTVVDSSRPYSLRLEQIYAPAIELTPALSVKVSLRQRPRTSGEETPSQEPPPRLLGTFQGVSRDLRESPYPLELDLVATADGAYLVDAEVFDGETPLGTTSLGVVLHKGIDARLRVLETGAAGIAAAVRADVLYPGDYIRNVNRGRIGIGTFDVSAELAAAEATLTAAKAGKDPFKARTGDMERHFVLDGANEIMPYRVYVPTTYNTARPTPLVIALHGLGANEDSFFDRYDRLPPQLAEKHGFLMAAPLGFRVDGFYGSPIGGSVDAASQQKQQLSEKDVLEVLRRMRAAYNVDESRIYLIGHSMGAIGAWFLGAKYPETWAALATFAGTGSRQSVERMKALPQFVVHGDADRTVNVAGSRTMVEEMKKLGMKVTYIEVPGGSHTGVVVPNLPAAFEFLAAHKKQK
jgi:poly(3-hydroxybutyrate) depolymerase